MLRQLDQEVRIEVDTRGCAATIVENQKKKKKKKKIHVSFLRQRNLRRIAPSLGIKDIVLTGNCRS
jgi:hypothetical protein